MHGRKCRLDDSLGHQKASDVPDLIHRLDHSVITVAFLDAGSDGCRRDVFSELGKMFCRVAYDLVQADDDIRVGGERVFLGRFPSCRKNPVHTDCFMHTRLWLLQNLMSLVIDSTYHYCAKRNSLFCRYLDMEVMGLLAWDKERRFRSSGIKTRENKHERDVPRVL